MSSPLHSRPWHPTIRHEQAVPAECRVQPSHREKRVHTCEGHVTNQRRVQWAGGGGGSGTDTLLSETFHSVSAAIQWRSEEQPQTAFHSRQPAGFHPVYITMRPCSSFYFLPASIPLHTRFSFSLLSSSLRVQTCNTHATDAGRLSGSEVSTGGKIHHRSTVWPHASD